jgi:ubiquinone/menaquinone biosynthesis C-methylase UbiE
LRERGPAFYRMFQKRVRQQGWLEAGRRVALDIGCGIGGGLLALAQDYECVVGLDISLSSLLIARKVLEEAGLTNVQLVHASAHQLLLADGV